MATTKKNKGQEEKITALYARLSDDDPENEKKGVGSATKLITHETVTHPAETHTETVHHDAEYKTITDKVWVEDKAAWTEEVETPQYGYKTEQVWVVDKAAWTESVVTGQKCSQCGATK